MANCTLPKTQLPGSQRGAAQGKPIDLHSASWPHILHCPGFTPKGRPPAGTSPHSPHLTSLPPTSPFLVFTSLLITWGYTKVWVLFKSLSTVRLHFRWSTREAVCDLGQDDFSLSWHLLHRYNETGEPAWYFWRCGPHPTSSRNV